MVLLDGRATATAIETEIRSEVDVRLAAGGRRPHLAAVLVGDHPASRAYVTNKVKACARVGFDSTLIELPVDIRQGTLLNEIESLNADPAIDGFIVQLPLPEHIAADDILLAIDPAKDVDGFHPEHAGRMALGLPGLLPATPAGLLELLTRYGISTSGMRAAVVGRSSIVGTPTSLLLSRNAEPGNCTVTLCHSRTRNLPDILRECDLVVAAIGRPEWIQADWIREGAVVLDVGINRVEDASRKSGYRLCGDVDFAGVAPRCRAITPVPGGVGPMTIAMLLKNTLRVAAGSPFC
jgi:methylenetetrahydrofolate dehydrogenase (NADP+)/methenyltetrahydrofolate cyclohydrolase